MTVRLVFAFAALFICPSICTAQQAASIDLTQIEARDELRRPPARKGDPTGLRGIVNSEGFCEPVPKDAPAVQTTLVWLDRNRYSPADEVKFEVRILNTGSISLKLPFSPHLADLQPADPGRKFAYLQMSVSLDLSSVLHNVGFTASGGGGGVALYGDESRPGTVVTLLPGEWAQIVGEGEFMVSNWPPEAHSKDAVNNLNATIKITRNETLLTSTEVATVEHQVCLNQTQGPNSPVKVGPTD
jgi:hypothetical protein